MADVAMPRLSDSMEEGTILKWLKSDGDEVKRGEELVEIETDKANMTYEADSDGTLKIVAKEGDTLPVGETIAQIGAAGGSEGGDEAEEEDPQAVEESEEEQPDEDDSDGEEDSGDDEEPAAEEDEEPSGNGKPKEAPEPAPAKAQESSGNGDGRVKASPVARRMARDLGVELAQLEGTGPGGRIVKADVQAAAENGGAKAEAKAETAEQPEPAEAERKAETKEEPERAEEKKEPAKEPQRGEAGAKGEAEIQELTRLQQTVSRRMAESKATAPEFSISLTVDMTAAVELRERLKQISDPVPSFNDMVVKASANALREFPRVNGAYRDGKFELYERVNVGIAVAAQDALVVPTVFDADKKSLGQIARDARQVIEKVKEKTVTPPELSGGTFTVSNLGMFGIEQFTAIINPPQAAILTVGKLAKQPAVDDKGKLVARDQMTLTLVCDHRILYGADGAQFLARVKELLEQPLSLAL